MLGRIGTPCSGTLKTPLLPRTLLKSTSPSGPAAARTISIMSRRVPTSQDVKPVQGKNFRLALVQLGGLGKDKTANLERARGKVLEAVKGVGSEDGKGAQVVVLPECFNSPYGVNYFPEYAETIGFDPSKPEAYDVASSQSESVKVLSGLAKEAGIWLIGGSIPERSVEDPKVLYNTSTVYNPQGKLLAIHRKLHLFDIDIPNGITFKESETLTGGNKVTQISTDYGKIGLGICYDIRFPEPAQIAARQGCIAMIYPSAFNTTTGPLHWELLQRARAIDNQFYVAMCSPARDMSADYHAWGHSLVADPMGKVISQTDEKESIIYADIDMEAINKARKGLPVSVQRRFDVYPDVAGSTSS